MDSVESGTANTQITVTGIRMIEAVGNDSGVVFARNRPFVLCVMTTYLREEKAGESAITRIAGLAYHYFDLLGRTSSYGRVISPRNSSSDSTKQAC